MYCYFHLDDKGFDNISDSIIYQLSHLQVGLNDVYSYSNDDTTFATILGGDHNSISHLDCDSSDSNDNSDKITWPVSLKLCNDGWIDSYRYVNSDIDETKDSTYPNHNTNEEIFSNEIGEDFKKVELLRTRGSRGKASTGQSEIVSKKSYYRIDYIYSKNGLSTTLKPMESFIVSEMINSYGMDRLLSKTLLNWPSDHNAIVTKYNILHNSS